MENKLYENVGAQNMDISKILCFNNIEDFLTEKNSLLKNQKICLNILFKANNLHEM